jgi:hypothetical protein
MRVYRTFPPAAPIPLEVLAELKRRKAAELIRQQQQGLGNPIVAFKMNDQQEDQDSGQNRAQIPRRQGGKGHSPWGKKVVKMSGAKMEACDLGNYFASFLVL